MVAVCGGQNKVSDPPELEVSEDVWRPMWVLGAGPLLSL